MEANKILQSDLLDLLFTDRNKEYGAYELRRKYNKRITTALLIMASLLIAIMGATFLQKALAFGKDSSHEIDEVVIHSINTEPTPPPPPPVPQLKTPSPPQIETRQFTPPVIKKDEDVTKDEIPPVKELEQVQVADKTQDGIKDDDALAPPVIDNNTQVVETRPVDDENTIFTSVEIEANVNQATWRRHLESQLQRYIEDAVAAGMIPGTYTVNVRFLVEKDGSITSVQSLNDPGYGLAAGAVDVVKRGPRWNPGEQNNRKVRSWHTQPITFVVQEQ